MDSERRAVALFEEAGLDTPARLARVELAWMHWAGGDLDAGIARCRDVLAEAATAGDATTAIWALQALGSILLGQGAFRESGEALRRSTALAAEQRLPPAVARGQVLQALSLQRAGQLDEAATALEDAAAWGSAVYAGTIFYEVAANLAWLRGDLPAVARAVGQLTTRHPGGLSLRRAWVLALAARAAAEMDRPGEARNLLTRAEAVYDGLTFSPFSQFCGWAAGALQWISGHPDTAVAQLEEAARTFEVHLPVRTLVLVDLCEVAASAGHVASAARGVEQLEVLAAALATDVARGLAALGNAWRLLATRAHVDAAGAAENAAHLVGSTGHALLAGRAAEVHGRALLASDRHRACDLLEQAADAFDGCQAVWRRDRVRRLLTGLGHRGRRAAASTGSAALSAREREVVDLAASGHTAREIAARLFIGKRTVETHIANAYAKLGVANRRELRAWALNRRS